MTSCGGYTRTFLARGTWRSSIVPTTRMFSWCGSTNWYLKRSGPSVTISSMTLKNLIAVENNTTILKFFLHISKEEQLARFKQRLDDPARNWKISESDYKEREYWDDYTEAYEDLLRKTSTEHAPWFIIPSDHKWFRDLRSRRSSRAHLRAWA